jgi:hypothetical protein
VLSWETIGWGGMVWYVPIRTPLESVWVQTIEERNSSHFSICLDYLSNSELKLELLVWRGGEGRERGLRTLETKQQNIYLILSYDVLKSDKIKSE